MVLSVAPQRYRRCLVHPSSSTQGFLVALEIILVTLLGRCYSPSPITHLFKRSHRRWLLSILQLADDSWEGKQTQTPLDATAVCFLPTIRCPLSHHQHKYHPHSPFLNSVVGTIIFAVWWPSGCQSVPVSVTSGKKVNTVVSIHWKKDFGVSVAIFPTVTFDWKF